MGWSEWASNKLNNLRCTHNHECIKIQQSTKSGVGFSDVYEPNLKWVQVGMVID